MGTVPLRLDRAPVQRVGVDADERAFLLRVPHVGRFLARNGDEVIVDAAGAAPSAVARYLEGPVLAALWQQRGSLVMRGAAVVDGDEAVLLVGACGSGASTLAGALVDRGQALVSDGWCAVGPGGAAWGPPRLHLWDFSCRLLGRDPELLEPVQPGSRMRVLPVAQRSSPSGSVPVRAVVVLTPVQHPAGEVVADSCRGTGRFLAVLPALHEDTGRSGAHRMEAAADLVRGVPVIQLCWTLGSSIEAIVLEVGRAVPLGELAAR